MDVRNLPSGPGDFIRPDNAHRATFNVFICFNEEDGKDLVEVCKRTCAEIEDAPEYKQRGITIVPWSWLDCRLDFSQDYQCQIESQSRFFNCQIVVAALKFVLSDGVKGEIESIMRQPPPRPALFVIAPEPESVPTDKIRQYQALQDYLRVHHDKPQQYKPTSSLEDGFAAALRTLIRTHISSVMAGAGEAQAGEAVDAGASEVRDEVPFFPGLAPWPSEEWRSFGGRDAEIVQLVPRLHQNRVLHLKGASGAGKSSLVYAGILPRLSDDYLALKPGLDPFVAFVEAVGKRLPSYRRVSERDAAKAANDYTHFVSLLGDAIPLVRNRKRVLFVDQLEELLLSSSEESTQMRETRNRFAEYLVRFIKEDERNLLITTGRADVDEFLSQTRWRSLGDLLNTRDFRIYPPVLSHNQLRQMIGRSAAISRFGVEDRLIDMLHRDLHEWREDDWPPVFGLILEEIVGEWQRGPYPRELTAALYEKVGQLPGVIRRVTDAVADDAETLQQVFPLLVRLDNSGKVTKRRISWHSLEESTRALLMELKAKRLVRDEGGIELSHDILFREWLLLRQWIDQRKDDLDELTDLEHRSRRWERRSLAKEELLPSDKLAQAAAVLTRNPARERELPLMRRYVNESQKLRDQEALVNAIKGGDMRDLLDLIRRQVELTPSMIAELNYPYLYYAMFPQNIPVTRRERDDGVQAFQEHASDPKAGTLDYFDGLNLDGATNKGFHVQHFAALAGQVDVLAKLKQLGLDMMATSVGGSTPFALAAYGNSPACLQWIWDSAGGNEHARLLAERNVDGFTPLHWASDRGHLECVRWLVTHGADVNAAGDRDHRPLSVAAAFPEVVRFLIDAGADPTAVLTGQWAGSTPLHAAAVRDAPESIALLMADPRVDPNAVVKEGSTALHFAAQQGHVGAVDALLRDERVDPNLVNESGRTPLHSAVLGLLHTASVERLLADPRVNPNAASDKGNAPLHYAVASGNLKAVELLLADSRIDPNLGRQDGKTALAQCLWGSRSTRSVHRLQIGRKLLSHPKVDCNIADQKGKTALHGAAEVGDLDAVDLLLADSRVDRTRRDKEGWTPFDLARDPAVIARFLEGAEKLPLWSELVEDVDGQRKLTMPGGEALRARIANDLAADAAEWPIQPLIPGRWEAVGAAEATKVLCGLAEQLPRVFGVTFTSVDAVRRLRLDFYEAVYLYEARVRRGAECAGYLTFLARAEEYTWLTGTSPPIHELNARLPIRLTTANVLQYLQFFCGAVHAEHGAFTIYDSPERLLPTAAMSRPTRTRARSLAAACTLIDTESAPESASDIFIAAVVKYASGLFKARFRVYAVKTEGSKYGPGMVEMLEDSALAENLPVLIEVFEGGVRTVRPAALTDKPSFVGDRAAAGTKKKSQVADKGADKRS